MSSEEQNREPDPRAQDGEEEQNGQEEVREPMEPVEEVQGSPMDLDALADPAFRDGFDEDTEQASESEAPSGGDPETAAREIQLLKEELEAVEGERDEYLDALRRARAEFENFRKRQERERARLLDLASEKLVAELLPVLDNLERALEAGGDIRGGVQATRDQLAGLLENEGLTLVSSDGEHFDPNVHEAVMGQSSEEHEEGTIVQTFQRGYMLNGKLIRAAKVVVAQQG